jgi:hypothetical protein
MSRYLGFGRRASVLKHNVLVVAAMLVCIGFLALAAGPVSANSPPVITTDDVTTAYADELYYVDYDAKDPDRGTPVVSSIAFFSPARKWTSAAWAGDKGYAAGGLNFEFGPWVLDEIVEVPTGTVVGSTEYIPGYPPGRYASSAVWANDLLYVFGGQDDASLPAPTIKFDPVTQETTMVPNSVNKAYTSAAFDGQNAYVFGGTYDIVTVDDIYRFDPESESTTMLSVSLPTARYATSAVCDGQYVYIFGGDKTYLGGSGLLKDILRFDPVAETVETLAVQLPSPRSGTSAAFDGYYAYIFGGFGKKGYLDEIVRFDPVTETIITLDATLPTPRSGTSAFWTSGDKGYILGGDTDSMESNEMVTLQIPMDTLQWTLDTDASWLSIDAQTGVLQGTPSISDVGSYPVKVTVSDGKGGEDFNEFTLTVQQIIPNTPPELGSGQVNPESGYTDDIFTYTAVYTDADDDAPAFIRVHIDGDGGHEMSLNMNALPQHRDGTYTNGEEYKYETTLGFGVHDFHFEAGDGEDYARDPETGEHSGPSVSSQAEDKADSDIPVAGTVSGDYLDTHSSDDVYESITEVTKGKKKRMYNYLEHKWSFTVTGGSSVTFHLEAYKSESQDGDDFVFEWSYSVDSGYVHMLTVQKTSDDDQYQTFALPGDTQGVIYIRVLDTDRTRGSGQVDTIFIDNMFVRSVTTP